MFESTNNRNKGLMRQVVALTAVGALVASSAQAVTISPVMLELTPARRVVAVTVSNDSDSPLTLQAETLEWTQPNGEDRTEANDDLLVVPPLAEIRPGGSQIFRVTLRRPASAIAERAYRLVLDDVSGIKRETKEVGVNISFSHRLPVFVAGTGRIGANPRLGKCSVPAPPGCVRLDNEGDRFVQVKRLSVEGSKWRRDVDINTRVLSGAWKQWTFDSPANYAGALTVNVETTAGPLSIELPARPR